MKIGEFLWMKYHTRLHSEDRTGWVGWIAQGLPYIWAIRSISTFLTNDSDPVQCNYSNFTPQVERKIITLRKSTKCMCMPNILAYLSKPERTYWWSLTPQLDAVVIEEPSVKVIEYVQDQTFTITKWKLWWHRILQCTNYLYLSMNWYLHLLKMKISFFINNC